MTDADRGIHYADGGIADVTVHYPDRERMKAIDAEWDDFDAAVELEVAKQMTIEAVYRPNALLTYLGKRGKK